MTDSIMQTADEMVTEITLSSHRGFWLIVEGSSDEKFFRTYDLKNHPRILAANGWENVITVVKKALVEEITDLICGVIDKDYRKALAPHTRPPTCVCVPNIVETDHRDLEIMMFYSDAFRKVIVEFGSPGKLPTDKKGAYDINEMHKSICKSAEMLARLRFYCESHKLGISFSGLDFSKFCSDTTLDISTTQLVNYLSARNNKPLSISDWQKSQSLPLPVQIQDKRLLLHGHDVMNLISLSLKSKWGSKNRNERKRELIESSFRIGYSSHTFKATNLYKSLDFLLS